MECWLCKIEMKCYNDVNEVSTRIDWVECPKCKSKGEIIYGGRGAYVSQITWNRNK